MRKDAINLIGQSFGRLTVIGLSPVKRRRALWICRCQCGNTSEVQSKNLRRGRTKSCGCLARELRALAAASQTTHGHSRGNGSPEYNTWHKMRQRCLNPNDSSFPDYGGRGISICERWNHFENFLADMGPRPIPELSIDRINNDGNYEPGNCRWATLIQQANNQRTNRRIEWQGRNQTIAEWAREIGITHNGLWNRLHRGWPLDRALSSPNRKH